VTLAPTGSTLTRSERRSLAIHEAVLMHLLEDPDRALAASCDKDDGYVNTLAAADLVDLKVVRARLASTPGLDRSTRQRIEGWLRSKES
jgi:hypothetical protein